MINMPTVDIMTLIAGEVEKPAAPVADDGMADASFLSFIAEDEIGFEQLSDESNMVPDSGVDAEENSVDIPVAKMMFLSGLMDQQVAIMPADRSLILNDTPSVLYVSPEIVTKAIQPDLLVGSLKDRPVIAPVDLPPETSGGAPVLQDTDVAQAVPRETQDILRQTRDTANVLPQMGASDKQTNAVISTAISSAAPKQAQQPATLAIPQKGGDAFQHNVLPELAARPRPQIPVSTDPDVVPSSPANTVIHGAPTEMQKAVLDAPRANEITSGKRLGHALVEATETKENQRGQSLPIPQTSKGAEISKTITLPKVQTIAMPPNQHPAAAPFVKAGLETHATKIAPMLIQAPLESPLPNADLPVSISRPTAEFSAPQLVNAAKELAPDNGQLQKTQTPLPLHPLNRSAYDLPNRVDPPQLQATIAAPLQANHSTLPSAAHPFAPLQPAVTVPQLPKRQTSEGQLPQPDVQLAKQTTADAPVQTTVPTPLAPMAEPTLTEGTRPELNLELIPLETRVADSTTIARHDTIIHRPEVGRHIAQQLAEAARQMPDRPVELTLNPDELGRVRLTFTMSDGGIHVGVITERGETMDLLRRHIETLAQEFRDMGYKDVNFDFSRSGQGNSGNTDSNPDDPDTQTQTSTETQTLALVQLSLEPPTGLDLRL